jgi:hypothetical protein
MSGTRFISLVLFAATLVFPSIGAAPRKISTDEFLEHLLGSWTLTGTMGTKRLNQRVDANWVLQGEFLQMHFVQDGPAPQGQVPYEAIYMLGFDREAKKYVLQLFDTFGPAYSRTIGIGTRQGNAVEFLFDYPDGLFSNLFSWEPETGHWTMLLRQREGTGPWKVFATKTLTPRGRR